MTNPLDGIEQEEIDALTASDLDLPHARFVRAYMQHGEAARAVRDAGLEVDGERAVRTAHRIMALPDVKAVIVNFRRNSLERMKITPDRIEMELARVAFASMGRFIRIQDDGTPYYDLRDVDVDDLAAIGSLQVETAARRVNGEVVDVLKIKLDLHKKMDALGQLARIRKMVGADVVVEANVDLAKAIQAARMRAGMQDE